MSLFLDLLVYESVGFILLIIGLISKLVPAKNINSIIGYRTRRSMKNEDTWNEANMYFPYLMIKASILSLIIGLLCFLLIRNTTGILIAVHVPLIFLIHVVYTTEKHLKKIFDEDGRRYNR